MNILIIRVYCSLNKTDKCNVTTQDMLALLESSLFAFPFTLKYMEEHPCEWNREGIWKHGNRHYDSSNYVSANSSSSRSNYITESLPLPQLISNWPGCNLRYLDHACPYYYFVIHHFSRHTNSSFSWHVTNRKINMNFRFYDQLFNI